ncbi:type II toxin-antitoxin system VapC family toxin [Perlucidibaca aquatica]|uniref:type II toxin-antitoxin system VapC family toxin n=1 Tax=Perlucidibaca aquatica TaxID=1852776 RepID=UPI00083B386D|nr:PIN domain-containing protein [Perlucidibaca aquatica]
MNVFLDANALIYLFEGDSTLSTSVQQVISRCLQPSHAALMISALTLLECRVRPMRHQQHALLQQYDAFFASTNLRIAELSPAVMQIATVLRAHHGLKTPDALQAASCLAQPDQHVFITADAGFQRVPGLQIEWLLL